MPGQLDEPGADDKTTKTDSALLASVQEAGQQASPQPVQDEQQEVDEQEGQSPT